MSIPGPSQYSMTLADLLTYLHQQLLQGMGNEEWRKKQREGDSLLSVLCGLQDAATYHKDWKLFELLDDMIYVVAHVGMNITWKAEAVLFRDLPKKLDDWQKSQQAPDQ
ncbi:MAG TPA: hypothetical protein VJ183_14950 [Chloroflexia bacterium]|nr:hypothetical protein [Chloroflexia bacterium]